MKQLIKAMFILGFSLTQFSCYRPESFNTELVRKSIEKENIKFSEAMRKGNLAGVIDAYTIDATMIPPDGEIIKGKEAIKELYKKFFQIGMKEITLITLEVGGCGDIAYEIGKTKVRIQPEGQPTIIDSTKYLVIWKRQADATWKVYTDIWNFSKPVAGK